MKNLKKTLVAIVALAGVATAAQAGDLAAYRGQPIDLGVAKGVAYYTVDKAGFRVVATLADAESKAVRFEAVLSEGQSVVLSAPAPQGQAPVRIEISRHGDRVEVLQGAITN